MEIRVYWSEDYEVVNAKRFFEIVDEVTAKGWHIESMEVFGYTRKDFMVCFQ